MSESAVLFIRMHHLEITFLQDLAGVSARGVSRPPTQLRHASCDVSSSGLVRVKGFVARSSSETTAF